MASYCQGEVEVQVPASNAECLLLNLVPDLVEINEAVVEVKEMRDSYEHEQEKKSSLPHDDVMGLPGILLQLVRQETEE
jgi:hypothetical protein